MVLAGTPVAQHNIDSPSSIIKALNTNAPLETNRSEGNETQTQQ